MEILVDLYSNKEKEIKTFLDKFFNKNMNIDKDLEYEIKFQNPIESADLIGVFVDNNDKYEINMWISLDQDLFINITKSSIDSVIRYLYERYPY